VNTGKILLLHAGGMSKRLPHHSATGKLFATVPFCIPSSHIFRNECENAPEDQTHPWLLERDEDLVEVAVLDPITLSKPSSSEGSPEKDTRFEYKEKLRGSDGNRCLTMLEMKLIMLIDMPRTMKPGVFITCADDIELFESHSELILCF
jgi:fucose-1-phosphate guanylyltransferase